VDRIARSARLNKAMLYYHFGSKLGVYLAVLGGMFEAVGARARLIADGAGGAEDKLRAWIQTIVEEAGERPWFPPIMLREIASGGAHLDPPTLAKMNAVLGTIRDIVLQGQRERRFRVDVDPLLAHLTIVPVIMLFFARQNALGRRMESAGIAAPIAVDRFLAHITATALRMLRADAPDEDR
jgi:AcrR family transcriptional regulator